jgi:uncharacterized membrane protein
MIWILLGAVWFVGAILFYALDGYFKYGFETQETSYSYGFDYTGFIAIIWFIAMWFVVADRLRDFMGRLRENQDKKEETFQRIRIAKAKEMEAVQQKAEQELAQYMDELEQNSKQRAAHL